MTKNKKKKTKTAQCVNGAIRSQLTKNINVQTFIDANYQIMLLT